MKISDYNKLGTATNRLQITPIACHVTRINNRESSKARLVSTLKIVHGNFGLRKTSVAMDKHKCKTAVFMFILGC